MLIQCKYRAYFAVRELCRSWCVYHIHQIGLMLCRCRDKIAIIPTDIAMYEV